MTSVKWAIYIQIFLTKIWVLEKIIVHEIRVRWTVEKTQLKQKSPTNTHTLAKLKTEFSEKTSLKTKVFKNGGKKYRS